MDSNSRPQDNRAIVLTNWLSPVHCPFHTNTWLYKERSYRMVQLTREQPALPPVPGDGLDAAVVAFEDVDQVDSTLLQSEDGDEAGVVTDKGVPEIKSRFQA